MGVKGRYSYPFTPATAQAGLKIAAGRKKWKRLSLHLHNVLDTTGQISLR